MSDDEYEGEYYNHRAVWAFGMIEVLWNSIEYHLFMTFFYLSGTRIGRAYAVYFAVINHRSRREMTEQLAEQALARHPKLEARFVSLMRRLKNAAARRNEVIHTLWEWERGWPKPHLPLDSVFEGKNIVQELIRRMDTLASLRDDLADFTLDLPRSLRLQQRIDREQGRPRPASKRGTRRP